MAKGLFMRYQSYRPKRQFLAGVRCQSCQGVDTTVQVQSFEPVFQEHIECVVCGHQETRPTKEMLIEQAQNERVGVVKFKN